MALFYSTEVGTPAQPVVKSSASVQGGRLRRIRGTFNLATQTNTDSLVIGTLPAGATFAYATILSSAATGSAAIGSVANANTKFTATAALATTLVFPTPTINTAVRGTIAGQPSEADELIALNPTANLAASGTVIVDVYYSMP
jgi:hypothetical protein